MYPQAVYFPIRTLYLTLKIEQRERDMTADLAAAMAGKQVCWENNLCWIESISCAFFSIFICQQN